MDSCLMGHEDRQELETQLKLARKVEPLKDFKVKITLGAGNEKKTSVTELAEEYKASEGLHFTGTKRDGF